jgi:hypothetical protein
MFLRYSFLLTILELLLINFGKKNNELPFFLYSLSYTVLNMWCYIVYKTHFCNTKTWTFVSLRSRS